jgi:hypothetical protein
MQPGHTTPQHQEQVLAGWNNTSHCRQQTAIGGLQARLPQKWWATISSHFLASEGGWALRRVTGFWLSALGRGTQLKEWCIAAGDGAWKLEETVYPGPMKDGLSVNENISDTSSIIPIIRPSSTSLRSPCSIGPTSNSNHRAQHIHHS